MAKVTVTVCDACGVQEGVKHYEIRESGRKAVVDLCEAHGEPLEQVLASVANASQRPTKRATRARKVTTMEEIEALKKK